MIEDLYIITRSWKPRRIDEVDHGIVGARSGLSDANRIAADCLVGEFEPGDWVPHEERLLENGTLLIETQKKEDDDRFRVFRDTRQKYKRRKPSLQLDKVYVCPA